MGDAADPSPTGGRPARGKRDLDSGEEGSGVEDEERSVKERRLTARDERTLAMLASVPALHGSHRDHRGRRRGISLSTSQLVDAGLSANLDASARVTRGSSSRAPSMLRRGEVVRGARHTGAVMRTPRTGDEEGEEEDNGEPRASTTEL